MSSCPRTCLRCRCCSGSTPPGLELILRQEGVAFARVRDPHPLAFRGGRFVLYDGRKIGAATVRATLSPDHVPLDIDLLRQEERADPFAGPGRYRGRRRRPGGSAAGR